MAVWPFRRRSERKRTRSGTNLSDIERPPPRSQTDGAIHRVTSKKKQRTSPTKLQRHARTYSFSPGRQDSIRVDGHRDAVDRQHRGRAPLNHQDSNEPAWERTPTLYHKQSDHHPTRRKSSKRKRRDHDREAEVKAMSNFMPVRPATDVWTAGRPMKKESKRVKTITLGRKWEGPASDLSLPIAESLHSSLSSDSDFVSYKVSPFASLAPRPTLRYQGGQRLTQSRASVPARSSSQKKSIAEREPIPEETLKAHKRIDDLVDDLDASDLRELMERDQRRRDRKRQREQDRVERRLARTAEQRRSDEDEAKKSGTPPPQNLDRGVLGRELVGLGIEPASAVVTSSRPRSAEPPTPSLDKEEKPPAKPLDTFHRTDTLPPDEPFDPVVQPQPPHETEEHISALPQGSLLAGLLRSKKSRSKSTLASDKDRTETPPPGKADEDDSRKGSDTSGRPHRFSLSSFLKRGGKNRRDSGPSSFSNTSREEMQAAAIAQAQALQAQSYAQAHAQHKSRTESNHPKQDSTDHIEAVRQSNSQALAKLQGQDIDTTAPASASAYLSRKPSSRVPKRTRSRFREDLPDFPLSPPDSRVQSPEAEPLMPTLAEHKSAMTEPRPIPIQKRDSPVIGHRSVEVTRDSSTLNSSAFGEPSPEPHQSMSLASIDSEGSWLSGRMGSRRASAMRDSLARANRLEGTSGVSPSNSTQEDLAITEDDYLSRLAPERSPGDIRASPQTEGRPSSDEDDVVHEGDLKWGAVGARPKVIHVHRHDRETMHSREGILNMGSGDEDETDSPVSPLAEEKADVQRATSVNVGKGHARKFSAGSAILLDLTPRASIDSTNRTGDRRPSSFHI